MTAANTPVDLLGPFPERRHPPPITQEQYQMLLDALVRSEQTAQAMREAMVRNEEQHKLLIHKIEDFEARSNRMEDRMERHFTEEHKSFDSLVRTIEGGKTAGKIIWITLAVIAGSAAAWEWVHNNITITPK